MRISDAHIHFLSDRFFQLLAGDAAAACGTLNWDPPPADPVELAGRWVQNLNQNGVDRAVLIASLPGDVSSVMAARAAYPDRFLAFAMVNPVGGPPPPADVDAICLFPAMHRFPIAGEEAARAIESASTVFVHCGVLTVGVRKKLKLPSLFDMRYSNPLDLHSVALKYPEKRFIVPHFGAGLLREALMLCDLCPNVYLDTSSSNSWMKYENLPLREIFQRALDVAGPGRLLFGTDSSFFPRGWNRPVFEAQRSALESLNVPAADRQKIFAENLDSLFPPRSN